MIAYENDNLIIPRKYKKMSLLELEIEKERVLGKIKISKHPKKAIKKNERGIVFKFDK